MVSEYLECSNCKKKVIAWSAPVLAQLDVGHRLQFPIILTYKYACHIWVIRMMCDRGLGNGPHRLYKAIVEQHNERYLQQSVAYLTKCKAFTDASSSGLVHRPMLRQPPTILPVPKFKWLLNVYCQDVLQCIDEVKAPLLPSLERFSRWIPPKRYKIGFAVFTLCSEVIRLQCLIIITC